MANPIGSVEASATTVNHLYPELDAAVVNAFDIHKNTDKPPWVMNLFRRVDVKGAYVSEHAWGGAPSPLPLNRGQYLHEAGFGEYTLTLYVEDYGTPVMWFHINDIQDSRAPKSMVDRANDSGTMLAQNEEFVLQELLTQTATTFLHEDTDFTTIFGSTGLFNDSHSFNSQSLDNSLAISGVSAANFGNDLWTARQTFREMVDDQGRPYWNRNRISGMKWLLVLPPELEKIASTILRSDLVVPAGATAPASNIVKDVFGKNVEPEIFEWLTDASEWFCFLASEDADGMRPYLLGDRKGIEQKVWNMSQSDRSRATHQEGRQWWRRIVFGMGIPQTALRFT